MRKEDGKRDPTRTIRRAWALGGIAFVAGLSGIWYVLAVGPQSKHLDALRREAEESYRYLETERELHNQLTSALERKAALVECQSQAATRVGNHIDDIGFLTWLSERTLHSSLQLGDYRPVGIVDYGDFTASGLRVSAVGSYSSVCQLLDDLRSCPQMNRVTELSMSPTNSEHDEVTLALVVELLRCKSTAADERNKPQVARAGRAVP